MKCFNLKITDNIKLFNADKIRYRTRPSESEVETGRVNRAVRVAGRVEILRPAGQAG